MKNTRELEPETTGKAIKAKKQRKWKDNGRRYRNLMIFLMAAFGIAESILSGVLHERSTDRIVALGFFSVFYSVIFLSGMEMYRLQKDWFYEKAGNYSAIARWYCLFCGAAVLFGFLPEFAQPVLLLSMGMTVITDSFLGMTAGIFHIGVLTLCGQENVSVLLCHILLLIGGCLAVSLFEKHSGLRWSALFLFLYTFGNILVFSFFQTGQLKWDVLIYGICNGVFSSVGASILYQRLSKYLYFSKKTELEKILSEDFGLVQAVWSFSQADYMHAKKVAEISQNCALLLGADPGIAAAGGFYYRLGRMEGEPYVENGVALAKSNRLPKEIIAILQEYNGEKKLPSTVESAIVHIVDSVVAKFDVLDRTTLSSSWNQDILVYQTLNENSASGLYDKSGFSMNMFLKIRDYLIKEVKLL